MTLWGNTYNSNIQKIIYLQKKALRIVNDVHYLEHTNSLYKKCKILKLQDVIILESLKFMYKYKLGLLPNIFVNYYITITSNTRQIGLFIIPKHRTNYRAFSMQIQGAKHYNNFNHLQILNFINIKSFVKYFTLITLESY